MNTDPASLQNLHDIVLPGPVPLWPPAPGWYLVILAAVLALGWLTTRYLLRRWRNRYRRQAQAELLQLRIATQSPETADRALQDIPVLIKRTALAAYPREEVATLNGGAWHRFLDGKTGTRLFSDRAGPLLDRTAYSRLGRSGLSPEQCDELIEAAKFWIRNHQSATPEN